MINFIKRFFYLFFKPEALVAESLKYSPGLKKEDMNRAVKMLRQNIYRAYMIVLVAVLVTLALHVLLNYLHIHFPHAVLAVLRYAGYLIILWGIFSPVGHHIRTDSEDTLPEIMDEELHRLAYFTGLCFLLLSYLSEWQLLH